MEKEKNTLHMLSGFFLFAIVISKVYTYTKQEDDITRIYIRKQNK